MGLWKLRGRDAVAVGLGYLIGSLPVGLWLGKVTKGVDVREYGSGATGATNVLRTLGPQAAAATFALDAAKGTTAVLLARGLTRDRATAAAAGIAAIAGHSWPMLAEYRGGKGVATALGALAAVSPRSAVWGFAAGVGSVAVTKRASVGSMTAAAVATLTTASAAQRRRSSVPLAFGCLATGIIVARHRENIRRLIRGTEPALGSARRQ